MSVTTAKGRVEVVNLSILAYRKYYLVSFWLETLIYGGYVFLFIAALGIIRKRRDGEPGTAKFFRNCLIAMFILISTHNFVNVYRMIHAYVTVPGRLRAQTETINYLRKCESHWDCFMFVVILALLNWIADILMIYRCYLVWGRSPRVIIAPCILFLVIFGLRIFNWYWTFNYRKFKGEAVLTIRGLAFPLAAALSLLTTSLIAFRIWAQHQRAIRAGLKVSSPGTPSLLIVMRIIVESAMIWTLHLVCITALYYLKHPAQIIVQHMGIPSIGIVFVLMAVRTHLAGVQSRDASSLTFRAASAKDSFALPSWLDNDLEDVSTAEDFENRLSNISLTRRETNGRNPSQIDTTYEFKVSELRLR